MNKIALSSIAAIGLGTALACGFVAGLAAGGDRAEPRDTSATVTTHVSPTAVAASVVKASPSVSAAAAPALVTVDDGIWTVGTDIPAGTYRTRDAVSSGCYWMVAKSGTNGEDILSNDLPSGGHPQVSVKRGQDFKTDGCGTWVKIK